MFIEKTKIQLFIDSLSNVEEFCSEINTSVAYLKYGLYYAARRPRDDLWISFVAASNGEITDMDMVRHFIYSNKKPNKI